MKQKVQRSLLITLLFFVMIGSLLSLKASDESDGDDSSLQRQFIRAIYDEDLSQVEELLAAGFDARLGLVHACGMFGCLRLGNGYLSSVDQNPSALKEIAIIKALVRTNVYRSSERNFNFYRFYEHPLDTLIAKRSSAANYAAYLLVQAGPSVYKYKDDYGIPLSKAVRKHNFSIVNLCLRFPLDHKTIYAALLECMSNVNFTEQEHKSSLIACGKKLIKYGEKNGFSQKFLDEALGLACCFNVTEMVEFLLEAGANPNGKEYIFSDRSLFLEACQCSGADILQLLLNAGADIDRKDEYGNGALHMAARGKWRDCGGNKEAIKFLLSNPKKQKELSLLAGLFE